MALIFCLTLIIYIAFVGGIRRLGILSQVLAVIYLLLGVAGVLYGFSTPSDPIFKPNYGAAFFLGLCIIAFIHAFRNFNPSSVAGLAQRIRGQNLLEYTLIIPQLFSIVFFLPFASANFGGDVGLNRVFVADVSHQLGAFGLVNTFAGAAAQLFSASLAFAMIRISQPRHLISWPKVFILTISSLSYVIYILAYVGRDGVVYWIMTALALYIVFRPYIDTAIRNYLAYGFMVLVALLMIPFTIITLERFVGASSLYQPLLEYFGSQIRHFGDYSTMYRPRTEGVANFEVFYNFYCGTLTLRCEEWEIIRPHIFGVYLAQGKEPWLFGTFISDWVGDFGRAGTAVMVFLLALFIWFLCPRGRDNIEQVGPARLLGILFLFLIPYWGVFYFRFGIANGFILVNVAFILLVGLLQIAQASRYATTRR